MDRKPAASGETFSRKSNRAKNLTGRPFGRLTARFDTGRRVNKKIMWHCTCECGGTKEVRSDHLIHGRVVSCGCWQAESARQRAESGVKNGSVLKTHGLSKHRVYPVYYTMLSRCDDVSDSTYGGRGISVCVRWRGKSGFENFISDMGLPPSDDHTIERRDNDGNYTPDNCHWATHKEQCRNRRNSRRVVYLGSEMLLLDVAKLCGVPYKELHRRLSRGWTLARATSQLPKNYPKKGVER